MKKRPAIYTVVRTLRLTPELDAALRGATRDGETEADAIRRAIREMTEREGK